MSRREVPYWVMQLVDVEGHPGAERLPKMAYERVAGVDDKADGERWIKAKTAVPASITEEMGTFIIVAVVGGPYRAEVQTRHTVKLVPVEKKP